MNKMMLLLGNLLLVLTVIQAQDYNNDPQDNVLKGKDIPSIKMLYRKITGFKQNTDAKIMLVFMATEECDVRWFYNDPEDDSPSSEITNMLLADAHDRLKVSALNMGDITASILTIPNYDPNRDKDLNEFQTLISSANGTLQYKIATTVPSSPSGLALGEDTIESIDSPEWMWVPKQERHFERRKKLITYCVAYVPHEEQNPIYQLPNNIERPQQTQNELFVFHVMPKEDHSLARVMDMYEEGSRSRMGDDVAVEKGSTIKQEQRDVEKYGHAIYNVTITESYAKLNDEGLYACRIDRKGIDDYWYLSTALLANHTSAFPDRPKIEMVPCYQRANSTSDPATMFYMKPGAISCLRCRAWGYPRPKVAMFSDDMEVETNSEWNVWARKYINVMDGGVSEALYMFRDSSLPLNSKFECRITNFRDYRYIAPIRVEFDISIGERPKKKRNNRNRDGRRRGRQSRRHKPSYAWSK